LAPAALVLGRLEPQKGHALMLEAATVLAQSVPALKIFFAGTGSLEHQLRAQCDSAGLAGMVTFLGYRADPEVLLAAADMVVMPSLYEGLPLAAIEAMAAARPVVATDIEGIREVVIDGSTGLLVRLAQQLAANGRRRAERHFDVRFQVEETVSWYEELLAPSA
jgi:glycosyltransferase involved in cell wall biosynthesis